MNCLPKRRVWSTFGVALALGCALSAGSCIARSDSSLRRITDSDASTIFIDGSTGDPDQYLPPADPHALIGVDPARGPFSGGNRALIRGNGFDKSLRIWFGTTEVAADQVLPVDAGRAQVVVPSGAPGSVSLTVQNGDDASTRRVLPQAYTYETYFANPATGPTSGGTIITLAGEGTTWRDGTTVAIDRKPCLDVVVLSETELRCRTPASTPGAKVVQVTLPDGSAEEITSGFTYVDSDNGFRGGLSGQPLSDELKVLALNSFTGDPIPSATVVLGDAPDSWLVQSTNTSGLTVFTGDTLGPGRTVTVAKKCFQPITFVDVPVDTVTVYLDPVLSPACADPEGELPPTGGSVGYGATVSGQLIWDDGRQEFGRFGFTNVPQPRSDAERQAAYVLPLSAAPNGAFVLPPAYTAVTQQSGGTQGYEFRVSVNPGNITLYALAGIENRSVDPPLFIPYSMGIARGVVTAPGDALEDVFIDMNIPVDHAVTLNVSAPRVTARGPDRLEASASVRVGELGYALLPSGFVSARLPLTGSVSLVGLPALSAGLSDAGYAVSARAVTGPSGTTPRSVIGTLITSQSGVVLSGFVEVPVLEFPASEPWNGTTLASTWASGGAAVDLVVYEIQSGFGLATWTVAAPGKKAISLPDLAAIDPELALYRGAIDIRVSAANIGNFDYGNLRYRHLAPGGWTAHATDVYAATY